MKQIVCKRLINKSLFTLFNGTISVSGAASGMKFVAFCIRSNSAFKAMRSIDTFLGNTDIRVWLCQIAKNCYFSHLKKQQGLVDIDDVEFTDNIDTIEEQIINRSDAMRIHLLLHNLAEPYKEVFMLRVFGELSFKQIAKIFKKTDNWACVTYHRARNKILEQMEANNE